jgi:hypothetical protein
LPFDNDQHLPDPGQSPARDASKTPASTRPPSSQP